jgi:hypothetical protein
MLLRILVELFVTCHQNISKAKFYRHVYNIGNMYHVPNHIQIPHEFFAPRVHLINIESVIEICEQILGMSFTYQNKKSCSDQHVSGNIKFISYGWKSAQNVLHEIQWTPRHVSSWTLASVQRRRVVAGLSDRHPQCDG